MKIWSIAAAKGLLVLVGLASAGWASAANPRMVYNPVTGRSEPETRQHAPRQSQGATQAKQSSQAATPPARQVRPAQYAEEIVTPYAMGHDPYSMSHVGHDIGYDSCGCGHGSTCGSGCGTCGDMVGGGGCAPSAKFYAGFEAVFVKPRFESNISYTLMTSDGASNEAFTEQEFDYDLEFSPRVQVGWRHSDGVGLRASWWHFDHTAATATANPPANGFGAIIPAAFDGIDISSNVATDSFAASTDLNAYVFDLEATKDTQFCAWSLGVGCGIRYARVEQGYLAQTSNTGGDLLGQIDYRHSVEGIGPTISAMAIRPINCQTGLFAKARGSLLYGDGESNLTAGEDLDLVTPFNTTRSTSRDDLLSIAEIQVGFQWHSPYHRVYQPFFTAAMEGQIWNGAGNATSEEGTLGFFGFTTGAGLEW